MKLEKLELVKKPRDFNGLKPQWDELLLILNKGIESINSSHYSLKIYHQIPPDDNGNGEKNLKKLLLIFICSFSQLSSQEAYDTSLKMVLAFLQRPIIFLTKTPDLDFSNGNKISYKTLSSLIDIMFSLNVTSVQAAKLSIDPNNIIREIIEEFKINFSIHIKINSPSDVKLCLIEVLQLYPDAANFMFNFTKEEQTVMNGVFDNLNKKQCDCGVCFKFANEAFDDEKEDSSSNNNINIKPK